MSLAPGTSLGVYQITALIGRGGMGEVYRARDPRLQRDVAIKVLPDHSSADPEWVSRFQREARALAALSHPNVAVIHGIEQVVAGGSAQYALILEVVEGETLADRLAKGPLPLEDALAIARQIADALAAAHDKGIVHRDLKPANVKITRTGLVKVLDFGLAKFLTDARDENTVAVAVTGPAAILGTPSYMAPEQAEGGGADKRADIWAFGVVLYEMLTGEPPFRGASVQETLAAVLTTDPDWHRVPPPVMPLLRACLERNPAKRLRDIGDYGFLIGRTDEAAPPRSSRTRLWTIAASAIVAVLFFSAAWLLSRPKPENPGETVRFTTTLAAGLSVTRGPGFTSSVAISPDGKTIVIAVTGKDGQQLYSRPLGREEVTPIVGTERGSAPFFSFDGQWIGFFGDGRLKRVPAAGGAPVDIAPAPGHPAGASWGSDNRIVFAYGADGVLHTVSADGGAVETLPGVESARHPEAAADGRAVLFESRGWIHAFDRESGTVRRIVEGAAPRYSSGLLILSRGATLLAAPVDLQNYRLTAPVVAVADRVAIELPGSAGGRHFAISNNGTLVYVPSADAYALTVLRSDGTEELVTQPQRSFENPRFSPDGRRIVVATTRREGEAADLWVHDLQSHTATRLTFDGGRAPVWTPDGASVTYSHLGERQGIYVKPTSGRGDARQLVPLDAFHWLVGWTPDRRALAYGRMQKSQSSIIANVDGQERDIVGTGNTWGGRLSRDGRWLAYYALESGAFEVYVTPFPDGGTRWLIAEGTDPAWDPHGRELYFRSGPRLMAARIDSAEGIRVLSQRLVTEPFLPPLYDDYDIHPDGGMVVMVRPANRTQGREVTMAIDWIAELHELLEKR